MTVMLFLLRRFRIQRTNVAMATGSKNCTRVQLYLSINCGGRHVQHYMRTNFPRLYAVVESKEPTCLIKDKYALFPRVGDRASYSSTDIFVLFFFSARVRKPKRSFIYEFCSSENNKRRKKNAHRPHATVRKW
mmetsp:Transcript_56347/g.136670  ORF Transcript_56347/g.136670 Transcript_56347/m.136670 type:complete len:133 (+) Transcript_56347:644-1042(+)